MTNYVTDDFLREIPRHVSSIVIFRTGARYNDAMVEVEIRENGLVRVNVEDGEYVRALDFSLSSFHTYDNTGRYIFIFSESNKVTLAIVKEQ